MPAPVKPRVGVDLMGSDTPPETLFQALVQEELGAQLTVFATPEVLDVVRPSFNAIPCTEVIGMEEDPLMAIRRKKKSSLSLGMQLLKEKRIDAFVSAGNTGALLLAAKTTLPSLPGIERPALLTLLPTHGRDMAVLDVGANLTLKPEHILHLAAMGIAYQKSRGVENPTVGLLNVGTEALKGTPHLRETYQRLETMNRNEQVFVGNIEGREAFLGEVDVVVCDGFTGNIFLKTAEGIANFILTEIEQESSAHLKDVLSKLRRRLHYAEYPGAILCGVDGIVVKCHGDSSPLALMNGIKGAIRLAEHDFLGNIKTKLLDLLPETR